MADPYLDKLPFQDIPDPAAQLVARPMAPRPPPLASPSPTRSERQRRLLLAIVAVLFWIGLAAVALGLRGDIGDAGVLVKIALWSALGFSVLGVMLRPAAHGMPAGARAVQICLVAVPLFYGIAVLVVPRSATPIPVHEAAALNCIGFSLVFAAGPLALAGGFLRRTFLSMPSARGATIGALCGLAGTIGIHTHCPIETTAHLVLVHGTAIFVCALFGASFGALQGRA